MTLLYPPHDRGLHIGASGLSGFWRKAALCLCVVLWGTRVAQAQLNTLEQGSNGTPEVPVSAIDWASSTITAQRGHYVEGSSIPYRLVLGPLLPGAHRAVIAWDTKINGRHNIDYLTHYNRLAPHNQFGAHNVPETIQPTRSLSGGFQGPLTFAIPRPLSVPESSFNNLPAAQRELNIYNGKINAAIYLSEGSVTETNAETRLAIDFTANDTSVAILFGGHLSTKAEWGAGQTASGIPGQEYRMRLVELDGLPTFQNVAVDAGAVVAPPTCDISGPDPVCPGKTNTYAVATDVSGASFTWTFTANTAGASFIGPSTGPVVQVYTGGGGGACNLQVAITAGNLQTVCARAISILTNATITPLVNVSICPGGTATFATQPSGTGRFVFRWSKDGALIAGQTNNQLTISNATIAAAGAYCVEASGACNNVASCATLTVFSNTTATPLANLTRCVSEGAVFSTTAGGAGPFRYRWLKNGTEIAGQTNRIFNIGTLALTDTGTYSVEVYGACNSVTNSATLTVFGLPPCGVQGPNFICPLSSGNVFTAPANFAGYRWRVTGAGTIIGPTNQPAVTVAGTGAGFLTLNLTVINSNGCSRSCSRTITVGDVQPPTILCPQNIETNTALGQCSRAVQFSVVATDDCDAAIVTCTPPAGTQFPKGTTTVNCTARDGTGNQAACSFNVTVLDLEKPTLKWPTNVVANTGPGTCDAVVNYGVTISDNCPGTTLTCSPPSGTIFPLGFSTVTCRGSDAAGNVESCAFDVAVTDIEGPQLACPGDLKRVADPGQCDVMVDYVAEAADNCAMADLVCIPPSGSLFSQGITTVICTATDVSHNVTRCSFQVQVDDAEKPRMVCPADIYMLAEPGRCDALVNFTYKAADNCRDVTVACIPPAGTRFPVGQTNVTCTATDGIGNSSSCSFKVTVSDNQRPVLTCPQDILVATDPGRCSAVVQYTNTISDNCPGLALQCVPPAGSAFAAGLTVVNCFASDTNTNIVSCAFNVVVQDAELPQLFCPTGITTNTPAGQCSVPVNFNTTAADNCPGVQIICGPESGSMFPIGETLVFCVALDVAGNVQDCMFSVIVSDLERPVITCPPDLTVNTTSGRCDATATFSAAATDNCGAVPVSCAPPSGSPFPKGTNIVNCAAADVSGNTAACAFRVIVQDREPPAITCLGNIITNTAAGRCDVRVSFSPAVSDNCGVSTFICSPASGTRFPVGATMVTCIATDTSGNTNKCNFSVTVIDRDPPIISCPASIVTATEAGRCDAAASFTPVFSDNCGGASVICTPPSGTRFTVGETPVTCVATDAAGNTNQCKFTVTVRDQQQPQILCPDDIVTVTAPGACDAPAVFTAMVSDNCPGVSAQCIPPSGSRFPRGRTVVACTATDASSNVSACAFTVIVNDNQAPVISCPTNILMNTATGRCDAVVNYAATVTDNCSGASMVCTPPSGSTFVLGVTPVNCGATDASGNTNHCTFTVTVQDRQRPVITCPQAQVLFTSPGHCDAVATFTASAADNCDGVAVTCVPPSGSRFGKGVNTVTCAATDSAGNTDACSFTVTVHDVEPPVLTCPTNIVAVTDPGRCDAIISFAPRVLDECPGVTVVCLPPSGTRFSSGSTPVNCTATDASSNAVTCTFTVEVLDRENPALVCPGSIVTNTAPGRCNALVSFGASVTDNCIGSLVVCDPPSGSTFAIGTNSVVCIAIDSAGNQDFCAFTVAVLDAEKPSITCPVNVSVNTEAGRCDAAVTYAVNVTDNCSQTTVCIPPSGSRFNKGVRSVVCTATDSSGNSASCFFTVTVRDSEPPVVICPTNMTLHTEPGVCTARASFSAQVTDNCPGAAIACVPASDSEFPIGTTTVVCQGADSSGNARLCAFEVLVIDAEPPRLTCPNDLTVDTEPTQCTATVTYPVSGTDACSLTNVVCVPASGSLFNKGVTAVHCSARDASGNEATCAFNVTVRDSEAPLLLCPKNVVVPATIGRCDASVQFETSYSDNCPGATLACTPGSGSTFALGTTLVNCTATDGAGNTNHCSFSVRVIDNQRPVLTCSTNLMVDCETNRCDAVVAFATSVADNCTPTAVTCVPASGSRFGLGSTPVTCSSTDAAGNVGTCSFTVTVRDNQKPSLQCPANVVTPVLTARCDAPVSFVVTASDNCGAVSASCFPPSGSVFPLGTTSVACSAVDGYANVGICQFTVTVQDLESPSLQCPADIHANTAPGRCDAVVSFTPQASDNCAMADLTCSPAPGTTFPKGTNAVTCTARDASSNSVSCTFRVIVRDVEKPQIVCPDDKVVSADGSQCRARVTYSSTISDNCPGATMVCNPQSNSFFNKGVTTVVCVATDTSGNTNRCSFTVTVLDAIPPSISCPVNIVTNSTPGQYSAVVQFAPVVSDNCSGVSYVCNPQSGSVFQRGITPVACTATDTSGNTNRCSFTVTVNDTEPPVINCPTNLIIATSSGRCDAVCDYTVMATDNSQTVTLACVPPSGTLLPKGQTNILCTATDPSSNRVSCAFTITVVDREKPVITCGTNMTASTDRGRCDTRVSYGMKVTDNCGGVSMVCSPPSDALFPKGTNLVTCTATDSSGNIETCAFTVRVVDSEAPVLVCPSNMVVILPPGQCDVAVSYSTSVTDNCPGAIVSCSPPSGSILGKGIVNASCTARDSSGNVTTCGFSIDVRDQETPVITCPGDINLPNYPGSCGAAVSYSATVRDNCPGATLACNPASGSVMPVGTNLVTCNAADTSGNSSTCGFRVIIRDMERPVVTCPGDMIIDGNNGTCSPVANYNVIVRDNCPGATLTCIPPSGTAFPQGTNRVQCTAQDVNGNMSSCMFSVVVRLQPLTATPLQSQTRCAGETATFGTSPGGSGPFTFMWLKNGSLISGQTNSSILISNVTVGSVGTYTVVVQNPCGSVTNSATLQVNMPVVVSGLTNVTRCNCDPLVLSPVVSGTGPFSYLWRKNGSVLPGAISSSLAFSKLTTSDIGVYSVEVSGACNTAVGNASVGVITVPNPAIYTNSGTITINDRAPAFPYPSSVHVVCVPQLVKRATVTLRGFTHAYPDDVDVMLAAPDGKCVMLMSDAGDGSFANNINITLDDSAALALPDAAQLVTGTFRPGNYDIDSDGFAPPAPKLTPANTLSALAGTDANGFWSLFVMDDFQLDTGTINNGWVLRLYWDSSPVLLSAPRLLANGGFQMTITGDAQTTYAIEASTDLLTWKQVGTVTITETEATFTDRYPLKACFYRAVQP